MGEIARGFEGYLEQGKVVQRGKVENVRGLLCIGSYVWYREVWSLNAKKGKKG